MKILKWTGIALLIVLATAISLDAAGYGPGYFSSVTIRKTLAVTGVATFTATPVLNAGIQAGNTQLAGVDSFLTTTTADTVVISGVTATNIFLITGKTFNYSTAQDSVIYSCYPKVDTLIVTRYKPAVSGGAYKSGGQYSFVRIVK
jgi:hypothetical protein